MSDTPDHEERRTRAYERIAERTDLLAGVTAEVLEVLRHEAGIAVTEQAATTLAASKLQTESALQSTVLRVTAGLAVLNAVGLATPPSSWTRAVFIGLSLVVGGLLLRTARSKEREADLLTRKEER